MEPNDQHGENGIITISSMGSYTGTTLGAVGNADMWYIQSGSSGLLNIALIGADSPTIFIMEYSDGYGAGSNLSNTPIFGSGSITLNASSYYTFAATGTNYTFTLSGDASLSVGLSSFSANQQGNSVNLNWSTESETDNMGFILERKVNAIWTTIATYQTHDALKGQGNCSCATDYTFTDSNVEPGASYSYRLSDIDFEGTITINDVISITIDEVPELTKLLPATPNPFNPSTKIQYTLAENSDVTLRVVNMKGQTVQTVIAGQNQTAGSYSVHWNGQNQSGINAPSGIYLLVLNAGQIVKSQKIMLVR